MTTGEYIYEEEGGTPVRDGVLSSRWMGPVVAFFLAQGAV